MDFNGNIYREFAALIKEFFGLVGVLIAVTAMMAGHYLFVERGSQKEAFSEIVTVTGFVSPSLSTAFYEPNVLGEEIEHPASPRMQSLNRMGFVYAE